MQQPFTYAVVGAGAIGSFYGGKLALSGRDVKFLMRSDLKTVKSRGLEIAEHPGGASDRDHSGGVAVGPHRIHLPHVQAFGGTEEIGAVDVVLIGIKATANEALRQLIGPLLKENTVLVTLQNGLGNEEFLAHHFGAERVVGGLCFICLNRTTPGVIDHYGEGTLSIGEFQGLPQERTRRIVADFVESGIRARVVENLITERWRKLVWNIPFNGLSIAAGDIPTNEILSDEGLRHLVHELMEEVIRVAGRLGHEIPDTFIEDQIVRTYPMGAYKPSSMIDHMEGRPIEVEAIWGEPVRQAKRAGVDMVRTEMLYRLLKKLTA